jgi:hypothetical protein
LSALHTGTDSRQSNVELASHCDAIRLRLVVLALVALWLGPTIAYAEPFDIIPSDFNILDGAGAQVIGHGHYEVIRDGKGYATTFGKDRFNNGEYDTERDKLELQGDNRMPRMLTFEHTFFNADGTLQRVNKADLQTGAASCIRYENGQPIRNAVLQFPTGTFAGSAIVIPLKGSLLLGDRREIVLHDFNCVPGPKILKVNAYPQSPSKWTYFPSEVVRVAIKPDFGWLDFIIAPFVPEMSAWFSPADDWRFVGGQRSSDTPRPRARNRTKGGQPKSGDPECIDRAYPPSRRDALQRGVRRAAVALGGGTNARRQWYGLSLASNSTSCPSSKSHPRDGRALAWKCNARCSRC